MNTQFHRAVAGSLCFALLAGSTLLVGAGPLNPPAGAVTGTAKPLSEVEPRTAINAVNTPGDADSLYTITQPGSYYLTGNVTGESGKHGIKISANGVTVDLNGFEMSGVPGMGAFDGVTLSLPGAANVTVLNGSLRGWGDCGIELGSANNVLVRDVQTNGNAGTGILVFSGSTVTGCGARNNGGAGINILFSGSAQQCTAYANGGDGFRLGSASTAQSCNAVYNGGHGFYADTSCNLRGCSSSLNTRDGFNVSLACTVSECSAHNNHGNGATLTNDCVITGCTFLWNTLDAIECGTSCVVRDNLCTNSGGASAAGIHATGSDNRIEGNTCTSCRTGVLVSSAGNIIIRNSCSGNTTDWNFVANNVYGPIIDRRSPASPAVNGFSAASTLGSTDANANFSY